MRIQDSSKVPFPVYYRNVSEVIEASKHKSNQCEGDLFLKAALKFQWRMWLLLHINRKISSRQGFPYKLYYPTIFIKEDSGSVRSYNFIAESTHISEIN